MTASPEALRRTLPGRVARFAQTIPAAVGMRVKERGIWREIPWAEYWRDVQAAGLALVDLGITPGDHVAILSDNRPEWLFADLGAQGVGARSVGIYQTNPAADVAWILHHSQCRILFAEDQEQVDKAVEVAAETPTVTHIVLFDPRGTRGYADPRILSWEAFIARGRALLQADPEAFSRRLAAVDPASPATVVYTSGTTGRPKGALLSHTNLVAPADTAVTHLGARPDDTVLSYLPLCHVAEKIFTLLIPLATGATVHFGESIATVQEDLREVSPTIFLGVPRIWEKMHAGITLKMRNASWLKRALYGAFSRRGQDIAARRLEGTLTAVDRLVWLLGDLLLFRPLQERLGLRRCRLPISGAAPISRDLLAFFHGIGVPIAEGYGQTECGGVSHCNVPGTTRLGTVGKDIPCNQTRIADDGEILLRGPHVFVGYLHNEEATRDTVDAQGWLHTGDIGQVDERGFLSITGRKKEIIITSGGKNLSPEKIENALKTSPYVKEAVAIGDGRKFVAALVQIEYEATADWATRRGLTFTSFEDLTGRPEVRALIQEELHKANERLAQVESVRAFRLFRKELHQDDGELTATQKVRRRFVHQAYAALIEEMYSP